MRIITTRELRNQTKAVFEMAENERVAVKRGKKYAIQTMSEDPAQPLLDEKWVREFFAIPEEFRVNPFDISPSVDIYWADKRNVEEMNRSFEQYEVDKANGVVFPTWDEVKKNLGI
jgi:hypothetical protein